MMKTGKNNRFLASILAASMLLAMSPFAGVFPCRRLFTDFLPPSHALE